VAAIDWSVAGRSCLVTGATSGIGEATAAALGRLGARLVLVARDPARAAATVRRLEGLGVVAPRVVLGDLARQADVRRVAAELTATTEPLHVLVNNAGLVMTERVETADGHEMQLAVNHLAPFLLTNLLLARLRASAPARVVTVASVAHRWAGRLDLGDLESRGRYRGMQVYAKTKLMNVLFTRELARRLAGTGVTANCVHPGNVATRYGQNTTGILDWGSRLIAGLRRTPAAGADPVLHLCTAPELAQVSGAYFADRHARPPGRHARRDDDARTLWAASARLTGLAEDEP
jgi:NAD(P)-dependent dehydrogenase (short-subunit alcohol dehydrogenase family)